MESNGHRRNCTCAACAGDKAGPSLTAQRERLTQPGVRFISQHDAVTDQWLVRDAERTVRLRKTLLSWPRKWSRFTHNLAPGCVYAQRA